MKRKVMLIISLVMMLVLSGCNYQMVDTTYSYDRAILQLPDGSVVSGKVESWRDYEDGEQIQVKIDGVTYLCSSYNCVLIDD